jgi:hypothetical protein
MRAFILAAGAALTLSACGGGADTEANDANAMMADNMMMDQNMTMNDMAMNDMNMSGNMAVDPATQNMMMNDMNTNAPDTNLANGL